MSLFMLPTSDSIFISQNRQGKADKSYDKIGENNRITFKWSNCLVNLALEWIQYDGSFESKSEIIHLAFNIKC